MNTIRIGIVEDQNLFRKGLVAILKEEPSFEIVLEASNGIDFSEKIFSNGVSISIDILLLDLEMPKMNGLEVISFMNENHLSIKTIILSVHEDPIYIAKLIEKGASGYVMKNENASDVIHTIQQVNSNGFYMNEKTILAMREGMNQLNKDILKGEIDRLTKREIEVLKLICLQYSSTEIAQKLFLSARTVDGHRGNLLLKTGCKNIAGLVVHAIRIGVFNPQMQKLQ